MGLSETVRNVLTGPIPAKIVPAELLRPSFYGMLMLYYFSLTLYGLTAAGFGVVSIASSNGSQFTFWWSLLIALVSGGAGIGVWLSRRFRREWIEVVATSVVVGLMSGYGVAIITRALSTDHISSLSTSWLPFIISVLPTWRLTMIALEGDLFKHRKITKKG